MSQGTKINEQEQITYTVMILLLIGLLFSLGIIVILIAMAAYGLLHLLKTERRPATGAAALSAILGIVLFRDPYAWLLFLFEMTRTLYAAALPNGILSLFLNSDHFVMFLDIWGSQTSQWISTPQI